MRITVIGCGRWGSFIAWYLDHIGHQVTLYGREMSRNFRRFRETRCNDYLQLPESVALSSDLSGALEADAVVISVGSQNLAGVISELAALGFDGEKIPLVLCMKGIEVSTGRRLSQVVTDGLGPRTRVAVWLGPGHVQEFLKGVPNCMVIDSGDQALKEMLVAAFSSDLIRFYYGTDLIGNEIGAAAKNVIGIAAGMLDGLGLTTLKGALMSRGTLEISRLIGAMGGNPMSAYGLCHLGDYEATVFSEHSHNRRFGELFIQGKPYDKLAEGYYTVQALLKMASACQVELPICERLYAILFEGGDVHEQLDSLFTRSLKNEY